MAVFIAAVLSISTLPFTMLILDPKSSKVSRSFTLAIVTSTLVNITSRQVNRQDQLEQQQDQPQEL